MASATVCVKSSKSKSTKTDCLEQQEVFQAVVIADTFNDRFLPLTLEKPTVLFPLVNRLLLDYTLEALTKCGIQETFVFCCSHAQLIRNYISTNWSNENSTMTVTVLSSESFMSVGDVIRELDSQALIRSDFVLISGNTVTTLNLISILEDHKKCRKNDKGCSMTLIYRRALPYHKTRCLEDDVVMAVASNTNKVRYYQKTKKKKTLHIPLEVFQENNKVTVHYDLLNCHMCICSPSIPPLYSDNFDYQTLDDLIRGLIINEEILGSSMYLHLADHGYAAHVSNLFMYNAISRDIIQRWSYPVVPDLFAYPKGVRSWQRHCVYKDNEVDLHRTCLLKKNVVIGKGTNIGAGSFIQDSVIGCNCSIGTNAIIRGSYIWDNVIIGNDCVLETCLLADNVILKDSIRIAPGCILSHKVVIGDYVELPPLVKLQSEVPEENDGFGDSDNDVKIDLETPPVYDPKYVGVSGRGYLYSETVDSSDEDDVKDVWGYEPKVNDEDDEDDAESTIESTTASHVIEDNVDDDEDGLAHEEEDTTLFYNEVLDSLQRGIEEKIKSENLILEINSSKYAYNVTIKEVNSLVTKAILQLPCQEEECTLSPQEYMTQLKPILNYFVPLMSNYIKNVTSQLDCLQAIEDFILSNKALAPTFVKILHFLYEKEILNENVILKWFQSLPSTSEEIRKHVMLFVRWLQEADEESSED